MTGLVLEGGTFRGAFSAGFMDAFIEKNIEFPYIIGVSAGISNAASYVSKQFGRNLEIFRKYRNDPRYIGVGNYRKCGSLFGLDFVYDEIPNKLVPFDYDTYHRYNGRFLVGVTDAETGKFDCFNGIGDSDKWLDLRASCAIPGYFPPIVINGRAYYDGGLSSPICVGRAFKDGCDRAVVILTQPDGFVKKCGAGNIFMSGVIGRRFPNIENDLLIRHRIYNRQLELCKRLEEKGKILLFRPTEKLESFQSDISELERYWEMGYKMGCENAERIREFLGADGEVSHYDAESDE